MKRLSITGSDQSSPTLPVLAGRHPSDLFSDTQWFLYAARDVVFYHTFSRRGYTQAELKTIIEEMVELAPQMGWGYKGARPGQHLSDAELSAITSVVEVDDFAGMPDSLLDDGEDLFARNDLPLFRMTAYVRRGGPDAAGRATLVNVRASHALLEGSDSALLTRSQNASHGVRSAPRKESLMQKLKFGALAAITTTLQVVLGNTVSPTEPKPWGFRALAFERQRMRRLATALGISQRSLYFALVVHGLNGTGSSRIFKKPIRTLYTLLDSDQGLDDFFRASAQSAKLEPMDDFAEFARMVDEKTGTTDLKKAALFAGLMTKSFSLQRKLARVMPSLFGPRFWSMGLGIDIGLTMVPPHHATGSLTKDLVEPIYCGAYHPGANAVAFCPGRRYMTMTFSLEARLIRNVDRITALFEELERSMLPHNPITNLTADTHH